MEEQKSEGGEMRNSISRGEPARSAHQGHRRRRRRRNAVNRMIQARLEGVEFIAANTDVQALKVSHAPGQAAARRPGLTSGLAQGLIPMWGGAPLWKIRRRSSKPWKARIWSS